MEVLFLFYVFIFIFGTAIGSFLNVLVDRIPRGESVVKTRSHCEHCRRTLSWKDLIPLFSYLYLNGRCRYCHKELSFYYPFVELLTGLLFVLVAYLIMPAGQPEIVFQVAPFLLILYYYFLLCCFIVIFFTDLKYGIIPFKVVAAALLATLFYLLGTGGFVNHLLSALGVFSFFLLLFFITKKRGLGFGDVVYAFLLGFILGYPKLIVGLYIAFLTGAIVSLILIWTGKKKMKGDSIPFGPFLVGGTMIAMFYGNYLIDLVLAYLI